MECTSFHLIGLSAKGRRAIRRSGLETSLRFVIWSVLYTQLERWHFILMFRYKMSHWLRDWVWEASKDGLRFCYFPSHWSAPLWPIVINLYSRTIAKHLFKTPHMRPAVLRKPALTGCALGDLFQNTPPTSSIVHPKKISQTQKTWAYFASSKSWKTCLWRQGNTAWDSKSHSSVVQTHCIFSLSGWLSENSSGFIEKNGKLGQSSHIFCTMCCN